MLLPQLFVKVLHVEIEILLPVQLQHLLQLLHRHSSRAGAPFAVLPQPAITVLLVLCPPAPYGPIRHAYNLGCFPPLQFAGHRLQDHFLNLHHPLRFCGRNLFCDAFHIFRFPTAPQADISLANCAGQFTCYRQTGFRGLCRHGERCIIAGTGHPDEPDESPHIS